MIAANPLGGVVVAGHSFGTMPGASSREPWGVSRLRVRRGEVTADGAVEWLVQLGSAWSRRRTDVVVDESSRAGRRSRTDARHGRRCLEATAGEDLTPSGRPSTVTVGSSSSTSCGTLDDDRAQGVSLERMG